MKIRNILHKFTIILLIIGISLASLSGCGKAPVEGEEEIIQAREKFASLKSGVITVTDQDTGKEEQSFVFRYDEVGVLSYCLSGETGGEEYCEYSNGYETYRLENGEYSFCRKGDSEFQLFTSDVRHPMTDEDYIFFDRAAAESSERSETDGGESFTVNYRPAMISGDETLGKLTAFTVVYDFFGGELTGMTQKSAYEKDGTTTEYNYKVTISRRDSVNAVEMPEVIKEASGSENREN